MRCCGVIRKCEESDDSHRSKLFRDSRLSVANDGGSSVAQSSKKPSRPHRQRQQLKATKPETPKPYTPKPSDFTPVP